MSVIDLSWFFRAAVVCHLLLVASVTSFPIASSLSRHQDHPSWNGRKSISKTSDDQAQIGCRLSTLPASKSPKSAQYATRFYQYNDRYARKDFAVTWTPVQGADGYEVCWDTHGYQGAGSPDNFKSHVCALVQGGESSSFNNGERTLESRTRDGNDYVNVRVAAIFGLKPDATTACDAVSKSPYTMAKELGENAASDFPYSCDAEDSGNEELKVATVTLAKPSIANRVASGTVSWAYREKSSAGNLETYVCMVEVRAQDGSRASVTRHCFTSAKGATSAPYAFALTDTTVALYAHARAVGSCELTNSHPAESKHVAIPQVYAPFGAHLLVKPFVCLATKPGAGNGDDGKPQPLVYSSCKDPNVVKVKTEMDGAKPKNVYRTKDGKCVIAIQATGSGPDSVFLGPCSPEVETTWYTNPDNEYDDLGNQNMDFHVKGQDRWHGCLRMGQKHAKLGQPPLINSRDECQFD